MPTVTIKYFTHESPSDPNDDELIHQEHELKVPESEAAARVRSFYTSDGSTSAHKDDLRRWCPDLVES